jgi:glycosyltransferase involved in cell wall biosynthesis
MTHFWVVATDQLVTFWRIPHIPRGATRHRPTRPAAPMRKARAILSYGILSTYPPTQCGLATFSHALGRSLNATQDVPVGPGLTAGPTAGATTGVVAVVDHPEAHPLPEITHQWIRGRIGGSLGAAEALNAFDVAIIQHEFGIFGGRDGSDVLDVARAIRVPTILVLHTVLVNPSRHQQAIIEELVSRSAAVVVMTETARERLLERYEADPGAVRVIPHGAADNAADPFATGLPNQRPVILTWGLLGEGKGIEWAIEAMAKLSDLTPRPLYRVVGETHPRVVERHGERYREELAARALRLGVADSVQFDARYLDAYELKHVVQQADVVLLPYDSVEQVTSGVLIEAVTAGKPIISTGFPHARELLGSGAGLVVERCNPMAIADAVRRVLTEPGLAMRMAAAAARLAPSLLWPAVAAQYRELAADALSPGQQRATA